MTEPILNLPAGQSLAGRAPLPVAEALARFAGIVDQVAALHQRGRLHGHVTADRVLISDDGELLLSDPPVSVVLGGGEASELCPPELSTARKWELPTELRAAAKILAAAGLDVDPRRIDVYQLAVLLCYLVTGKASDSYLRSAKTRGQVPAELRPLIDSALGHEVESRLESCEQFSELLAEVTSESDAVRAAERETPAASLSDTPASSPRLPHHEGVAASQSATHADVKPFGRLGVYELRERIGGGGMGDVYKAHDAALDRIVAIKVLPVELARHPEFVARFRAEAMAIAKFTHPNIVQIFAFAEDGGRHFFAMQFVEGESLAKRLHAVRRLSLDETLSIIEQCLAGLGAAHARGLIHRDIKPGNVLLDRVHDRALLADFGLVKAIDRAENQTATGVIMGTLGYISPEQARGRPVDGRSDLYSLGALFYEMLSGRLPFASESATGLIFQHAFDQPAPLADVAPQVPKQVAAIVMRLLAKDPDRRYAKAEDVLADIRAFRTGRPPTSAMPDGMPSRVVAAPRFERPEEPIRVPAVSQNRGWRNRFWHLMFSHAPQVAQKLADTEHQVDGAVVQYERRRDELAALARDAAGVAADFVAQVDSHREAAAQAASRAERCGTAEAAMQAREDQARCERTAAEFESQLAEQREQAEEIQVRLSNVNATLQRLCSQRDVLQARMRAAQQQMAGEVSRPMRPRAAGLIAGFAAAAAVLLMVLSYRSEREPGKSVATPSDIAPASPTIREPAPVRAPAKEAPPPSAPELVDGVLVHHGLLISEYPHAVVQDGKRGAFVARGDLVEPLDKVSTIRSLTKWKYNRWRNVVAEGLLKVDVPGEYRFQTSSYYDRNVLYVDNKLVCKYEDGEKTISKIELQPGLVPIASIGYIAGRDTVSVQWAPPGQATMSEIPAERLFYPAALRTQRTQEIAAAAAARQAKMPPTLALDVSKLQPGLKAFQFGQLASQTQSDEKSFIVPPAELTTPLGPARVLTNVSPWKTDREKNAIAYGYLRADREGEYRFFGFTAWARGKIYLDGQILYDGNDGEEIHYAHLSPGLIPIAIVSYLSSGESMLLWQRPGDVEPTPIPVNALWHDPAAPLPVLPP